MSPTGPADAARPRRPGAALRPARRLARWTLAAALGIGAAAIGLSALADPPKSGHPPDPPGQASRKQWLFDVAFSKGKADLRRAQTVTRDQPAATARVFGRFAVEFWIGKELLDRLRFNVPLTGDDRDPTGEDPDRPPPGKGKKRPFKRPSFENVSTVVRVQMADHPRATFVQIVDRATGDAARFWWPPEPDGRLLPMRPPSAGPADGGSGDAGSSDARAPEAGTDAR